MSFTKDFTHSVHKSHETYTFQSAVNLRQRHVIERVDGGPWGLSLVDLAAPLSLETARILNAELEALSEFITNLTPVQVHRHTEPCASCGSEEALRTYETGALTPIVDPLQDRLNTNLDD